jgi:hypothetical protein
MKLLTVTPPLSALLLLEVAQLANHFLVLLLQKQILSTKKK